MPVFYQEYRRSGKWSSLRPETFDSDNTKISNTKKPLELRNKATNTGSGWGQHRFHQIGINAGPIQCKLSVNAPGDMYEQQADAMADHIIKPPDMDSPKLTMAAPERLQRKAGGLGLKEEAAPTVTGSGGHATGNGHQMDTSTLTYMSERFGYDFSHIKIHDNGEAARMNDELNARAFTVGSNIFFNRGEYAPQNAGGKQLLAHELTHTLQQGERGQSIQKDDKDKPESTKPSVDFEVLPPDLKIRMWKLLFEADTSKVHLDYETKGLKAGLSYKYGGALSLSLKGGGTAGSFGFTPGENQLSLGLSHGPLSAGFSAAPGSEKYGFRLGLGDKLLPSPTAMSQTFSAGGTSAGNVLTGLPGGLEDPLGFYQSHESDVDNITKSVDLVKNITDAGKKKIRFGADFSLSYDPEKHVAFTVRTGLMYNF